MFDTLISVLRGIFQGIWDAFIRAGTTVWGIVVSAVGIITALLGTINEWITDAADFIGSAVLPTLGFDPGPIAGILGLANRLFPLTELCILLAAWGLLCAVLMGYHIVKSWLPTVAAS